MTLLYLSNIDGAFIVEESGSLHVNGMSNIKV